MDKLREKKCTKRQIALMRLYHCVSLNEWKSDVFRRRMNVTRQRESRVAVVEILNTSKTLPKGTQIAVELIYCGLSLGRFLPLRSSNDERYDDGENQILESPYLIGELPLSCVVTICLFRTETQKRIGWVDVPLFHQERSEEETKTGERKSTDSASWKSKHDRGNFVPIGGNMTVSLFSSDDDNLYEGEILPEISVRFSMRKPSKHNGAYHDFVSRPQVYAFHPETMASIEEGRRIDPKRYVIKSGWVKKVKCRTNGSFSKEKSRWIVLRESTISWYANEGDEKELGSWELDGVTIRRCNVVFERAKSATFQSNHSVVTRTSSLLTLNITSMYIYSTHENSLITHRYGSETQQLCFGHDRCQEDNQGTVMSKMSDRDEKRKWWKDIASKFRIFLLFEEIQVKS